MAEGDIWRTHRRFALNILKDLGMSKSILEKKIQDEAEWLVGELKGKSEEMGAKSCGIDTKILIIKAVNNIISCLVFGSRCSVDVEFEEKIALIDDFLQNTPKKSNFLKQVFFR